MATSKNDNNTNQLRKNISIFPKRNDLPLSINKTKFYDVISHLIRIFQNHDESSLENILKDALKSVSLATDAESSHLLLQMGDKIFTIYQTWSDSNNNLVINKFEYKNKNFQALLQKMKKAQPFKIVDSNVIKKDFNTEFKILPGVKNIPNVLIPLSDSDHSPGFITLEIPREISEDIKSFLEDVRSLFSLFVNQHISALIKNEKPNSFEQNLLSSIPIVIYQLTVKPDKKITIQYVSDGLHELLGAGIDDFKNDFNSLRKIVHPDDESKLLKIIDNYTRLKVTWEDDIRIITTDGTTKWINARANPYIQPNGDIIWSGTLFDISSRKLMDNSVSLHSEIVEKMGEGIILIRQKDGIIVYTNSKFNQMFGFDAAELIGHHLSIVFAFSEKQAYESANKIMLHLKKHERWTGEIQNFKKDGSPFWATINSSSFNHQEFGKVWFSVYSDITERILSEKKLKQTSEILAKEREELNAKNIALREILKQIEQEKQEIRNQIGSNIENIILPTLRRIKNKGDLEQIQTDLNVLEKDLINISSDFVDFMKKKFAKLTPREIEICNMIKNGLSSKEISNSLNISLLTVHKHRELIRKKLHLQNKNINLSTYLSKL